MIVYRYNGLVDRYNGLVDSYNGLVDRCKGLVDRYSETLDRFISDKGFEFFRLQKNLIFNCGSYFGSIFNNSLAHPQVVENVMPHA